LIRQFPEIITESSDKVQSQPQTQTTSKPAHVIHGAPEGQDARILAEKARGLMAGDAVLVHVAQNDTRLAALHELLKFFAPDVQVLDFPAWDCLPYDRVSPNPEIVAQRVSALSTLMQWRDEQKRYPRIVLTTVNAILQKVMPHQVLEGASFRAGRGGQLDQQQMLSFLTHNGYQRTETVREAGEYSIRGSIIDLFPPGYDNPVRIDLFGDEIESIRSFDPMTQRSADKVEQVLLQPVSEFFLEEEDIQRFRSGYREEFGVVRDDDPLYEAVSGGRRYNGMEHWLPLFYEEMETIFDYIPDYSITLDHHALEAAEERVKQVEDFYQSRMTLKASQTHKKSGDVSLSGAVYNPLPPQRLYITDIGYLAQSEALSSFGADTDHPGEHEARLARNFADIRAMPDGDVFAALKEHVQHLLAHKKRVLIAAYSEGAKERLKTLLKQAGMEQIVNCDSGAEAIKRLKIEKQQIGLAVLALEHGFEASDLCVLTEADILGDRLIRKSGKKRKAENFLTEVSALSEGDLVVHVDHGIGKFLELETLKAGGTLHDCLKIEYAGGDKLYIPVENLELLSRFGADEGTVQLDKLGGAGWQARKAKAKKDLMEMADGLLKIAAARQLKKVEPIQIGDSIYTEFASRFPYTETEEQARAIEDVIESLGKEHPMDRLVCGDVGFGKTEVALRAAYIAAMDGRQVALIVPTTLLARQHYQNFMARFTGTGIRIEQLSRLVTQKRADQVRAGLADGSVHIVIATHALLGKGIRFNNLGLLIVDEEQKFGVKQKEKLKELKNDVHVLTLTATPIPRTLQMSLTGVKEMSLITTPPVDRLAVRTFVMPFDDMVVREALLREHFRGGQSFYVCPRISDMAELEEMLKELVPEVKVITAHGQLPAAELEERMEAFAEGKYDVLLATNIIESGIDIPSANTMIIHRADMFGLAQLYQIRGRIGRSKVRAYAYLTYKPGVKLNAQAQKRLEVMDTLDTLGAGFQLASHDMDIRGAGNLLGDQQSGHIKEVGVELYQQMLEDAVAAARAGVDFDELPDDKWTPSINLGTSVLIPETYVEDLATRMSLYRRLADIGSKSPSSRWHAEGVGTNGVHKDGSKAADISGSPPSKSASQTAGMTSYEEDIEEFAAELIDRFGELPEEVNNLLDIVAIKQLCKKAGVDSVEAGPKGVVIGFHNNIPPNVDKLMGWLQQKAGTIKLRPDQKLVAVRHWDGLAKRVQGVRSLMRELSEFH